MKIVMTSIHLIRITDFGLSKDCLKGDSLQNQDLNWWTVQNNDRIGQNIF